MDNKEKELSLYRLEISLNTMKTAHLCMDRKSYRDAINRYYYAAFYAVKAVLALDEIDFKRHKDVVAHFNKNYVSTEIFPKKIGKMLGNLQKKRETSDYDDFYIVSKEEAETQMEAAEDIVNCVIEYLKDKDIDIEIS